jgi:UDP-N-acetylmuramoyl-tripeptide--D-alanyl-D-alanine ligase
MTLWTADEAAQATGGVTSCEWQATGVSIDTRTLQAGDLFVALQAARDGHEFVAQALANGAAAALVTHVPDGVSADAPLLVVDDVLAGLESLGRAARARTSGRVAAITGSAGKTSTKEMLVAMLADQGAVHASVASYNNHWGVPLTLARMPRDTDFAIIEIGMNHPGEISPLACQARPHVAMVTTVAAAHLEAFDDVAGIAHEKASVMAGLEPDGVAVLNADVATAQVMIDAVPAGITLRRFGAAAKCDLTLGAITEETGYLSARAVIDGAEVTLELGANGAHFAMNALGALAVCDALGADRQLSLLGLQRWRPVDGRGARETIPHPANPDLSVLLIDDSYNANPASMAASLDVLAAAPTNGRRIAFVGDMKELGPQAADLHADLSNTEAMRDLDVIHCVGPLMQALHSALPEEKRGLWRLNSADLAQGVLALVNPGDTVLIKGSLSMGLAVIVDAIREIGEETDSFHHDGLNRDSSNSDSLQNADPVASAQNT